MPSALSTERVGSRLYMRSWDHDPGATTAIITSPDGGTTKRSLDLSLFGAFAVQVKPTIVAAGGLTKVEIIAADDSAMTANVTVVKDSGTIAADALDDNGWLECTAEEVAQLSAAGGFALRYVAARLTMATATDEASVTYIGFDPRHPRTGLTAQVIT